MRPGPVKGVADLLSGIRPGAAVASGRQPRLGRPRSAAIVSGIAPLPRDNGKRVVLAGLLDYLSDRFGPDNVHYVLISSDKSPLPPMPCVVHRVRPPGPAIQLTNVAWQSVLTRRRSLQEALLTSRRVKSELATALADADADLEIYDTIRVGQHVEGALPAGRRVLYLDDLFSVRYERMLDVLATEKSLRIDPLGEFAGVLPRPLRGVARKPVVYRRLLSFEQALVRGRETQAARAFDTSLLVNAGEAASLTSRASGADVRALTPVIDPPRPVPRRPRTPPEFIFMGRLNIPHNDHAVCTFLAECMPELVRTLPGARVRIVGKGASGLLTALAAEYQPHVSLEGYIEDIDELFAGATAALAPMLFGSGVKIKVIEALARGVPVLTTPAGVDGVPIRPDGSDGALVSARLADWPAQLARLADPATNDRMSTAAARFFLATYDRAVVYAEYDQLLGLTTPDPGRRR